MTEAVKVTVTDPVSGEVLDEIVAENDYVIVCAGTVYLDSVQRYANGTTQLTLKRKSPDDFTPLLAEARAQLKASQA